MSEIADEERRLLRRIVQEGPVRLAASDGPAALDLKQRHLVREITPRDASTAPYFVASGAGYLACRTPPARTDACLRAHRRASPHLDQERRAIIPA